jgi:hypothetical protein
MTQGVTQGVTQVWPLENKYLMTNQPDKYIIKQEIESIVIKKLGGSCDSLK